MSVSRSEIACYEYINAIRDIIKFTGKGIYGLDNRRAKLHDELCEEFSISKDATKCITDNIDLDADQCAQDLYLNLLDLSRSLKR